METSELEDPSSIYHEDVQPECHQDEVEVHHEVEYGVVLEATFAVTTALVPCLTFGQIAEVVDDGNTTCATSGLLYGLVAAFSGMPCIVSCAYRTKIRNMYGLVEAPASDWLTHLFCEPCALCQEYKELQRRGLDPSRGWQGNAAASGMNVRSHMTPPVINHRMN
ncbi:PREDICTED: protein PLANT CADMIUM RESISTANCE 6-like [Fragaria vesca subsp. vesca]|uniref:protein PLANT CADMIUM RESISTANCE 6-like n=1 Tax=Fragaria vesca subsp. vesca TaxID=101020 RepID=UPI0002C2F49E|nr:PREDICTED: protein PLANT CADMIUM RESISTANCE 6-like [Fragaria vesca subsp. vesca]